MHRHQSQGRAKTAPACDLADIIEWDIANWSVALDYWPKHTLRNSPPVNALEIGSRHGGISLWAALNGMQVVCTDLEGPSNSAVEKHKRYNVPDRITYRALDALSIPYWEEFDVVLFKSVLGGVGRLNHRDSQAKAIGEIHKSLRNGGELWFAENLMASPLHRFARKRYVKWGSTWRYVTIGEMKEYLSAFSHFEYTTVGFLGAFGRTPLQRRVLGRIDRVIADRLVPESWRYIIIGVASK